MEDNESEDFLYFFKDKDLSKTKRFNFKKIRKDNNYVEENKTVTSPFFVQKAKEHEVRKNNSISSENIEDSVERQLNNFFNGPSGSNASENINSNHKPSRTMFSKTCTVKDVCPCPLPSGENSRQSKTVAPVFLFNREKTEYSQIKSITALSAKSNILNKNNCSMEDVRQSKKKVSKFKFRKTSSNQVVCPVEVSDNVDVKDNTINNLFNPAHNSKPVEKISETDCVKLRYSCSSDIASSEYEEINQEKLVHFNDVENIRSNAEANNQCSISDGSSSPIIKPKKFIFKKKLSTSSSSSLSQLCSKNSPVKEKPSNETPKKKLMKSPIVISSDESSCKMQEPLSARQTTEVKKNLFSNSQILDDKVLFVDQSLETTEADFMSDEQFEQLISSGFHLSTATENKVSLQTEDRFDLNDIDWSEKFDSVKKCNSNSDEILAEINSVDWNEDIFSEHTTLEPVEFRGERVDDSDEFKKNYHFSEVMMEVLHQKFGLREFRPHQREVINASLNRHDCFVLMPTGGGKSLCYQLPAILSEGVTIVISPLRALISDQVDKLNALDIPAAHLCANVSEGDTDQIISKLHMREPAIKLLYLTPEKIMASNKLKDTLNFLYKRGKLARFVIDEAHCLSQWGHDFRPDYKQLSILRKQFKDVPIICLTATATKQVETDVINSLKLSNVKRFIRSFNRPNIKYEVIRKTSKIAINEISNLIKKNFLKKSGIIYCLARNDCESLAEKLNALGIKTKPYHAGMNDQVRENIQREWMQDRFYVIVATIAFGMGIDKPDVRFVIHNSIPKSVEAFYQESGRAGRDGETSYSYLFYSYPDVTRLQKIMQMDRNANKQALQGHMENLRQMVAFAENDVDCRRHLQLLHLGENFDRQICIRNKETTCDNCSKFSDIQLIDFTKEAKELGILVQDLSVKSHVTIPHIVDVYRGSKVRKVLERSHDSHKYYGAGAKMDRLQVTRILNHLCVENILANLHVYTGQFPAVYVKPGPKFFTLKSGDMKVKLAATTKQTNSYPELSTSLDAGPSRSPVTANKTASKPVSKYKTSKITVQCHEDLLEQCRSLALEKNVTLSSIMNLSALKSMSEVLPKTREEFLKIQHVTEANYNKFGEYFLKITSKYRKELELLQTAAESQKNSNSSLCDDDDFSPSQGKKRKSTGGYKRATKRYKGNYRKKPRKSYWKTKAKGSGTPKKKASNRKTKGGLALMPVHIK